MASCGNLGSDEALARDNELNKITLDPVLPAMGGPGRTENPPYGRPPTGNAIAAAIANVVPGHEGLGDKATHTTRMLLLGGR
jgi:hypothetical protein